MTSDFAGVFRALTGHDPLPWQAALYERFKAGDFPSSCNLPTGLGKTSVIAIWLIALANNPAQVPRRLVYVVNRRTVVDQTTDEVENLRRKLANVREMQQRLGSLAISTLRGQFADNREWSADPSRPAVICGTVDMIGSRLLFSGYGCGFKSKPLHAGFLGQDALLIHDEAHLEPAFQKLLVRVEAEQKRERSQLGEKHRLKVIELSATPRGSGDVFRLTAEDERNEIVKRRIRAKKSITFHQIDDEKKMAERLSDLALSHKDSKRPILVFARSVEAVQKVAGTLKKANQTVEILTGTIRGMERDALVEKPVFLRFLPGAATCDETVYLVCTSAGEVGVNISGDHLICDLSTFESMAQRFGRVNRFGDRSDTRIDIVHPAAFNDKNDLDIRRQRTLVLLHSLKGDGSPKALGDFDPKAREDAFSPQPDMLATSEILFDAWCMTSITGPMPGRPEVAPYLHGIADELPQTTIAWRAELDLLANDHAPHKKLQYIFAKHRIRPHETVTTNSYRVIDFLKAITKKRPALRDTRIALIFSRNLSLSTVGALMENAGPLNSDPTLVLPATFGGLDKNGMLSHDDVPLERQAWDTGVANTLDIADQPGYEATPGAGTRLRVIIERTDRGWKAVPFPCGAQLPDSIRLDPDYEKSTKLLKELTEQSGLRVRLVQPIELDDEGEVIRTLVMLTPASRGEVKAEQSLDEHVCAVEREAVRLADNLHLPEPFRSALLFAAKWHDEGKKAAIWQRFIGGTENNLIGKSARPCDPRKLAGYRHEFGSLLRVLHPDRFETGCAVPSDAEARELALHMIAAHHGFSRPHFNYPLDFDFSTLECEQAHLDAVRRSARLQRKHGRWGLAYLESLLRAADGRASADNVSEDDFEPSNEGDG